MTVEYIRGCPADAVEGPVTVYGSETHRERVCLDEVVMAAIQQARRRITHDGWLPEPTRAQLIAEAQQMLRRCEPLIAEHFRDCDSRRVADVDENIPF